MTGVATMAAGPKGHSRAQAIVHCLVAHVETWRPYSLGYAGLAGLGGAVMADPHAAGWPLTAAWLVPTAGWLAGLYGGDYFDRDLDAAAKPHRPIPSGRMAAGTALAAMIVLAAGGALIGLLVNWRTILVAAVALVGGISYSKVFKARGLSGNVVRGALMALVIAFGAMMTRPYPPVALGIPMAAFWLHDTSTNLVGTLRDTSGDKSAGYLTLPVRCGETLTIATIGGLLACWAVLATVASPLLRFTPDPVFLGLLAMSFALVAVTLVMLSRATRPIDPAVALRAHEVMSAERLIMAAAFVALAGRGSLALAVLAPAALVTVGAQPAMRRRYEFGAKRDRGLTAQDVFTFIDGQLAALPGGLRGLGGWDRKIEITLPDLELHVYLIAASGRIRRAGVADFNESALTRVGITTTSAVMRDIFMTGRTSPRRAYLSRLITLDAAPRDLLSLNQLFNEFRRAVPAPRPTPVTATVPQVAGAPDQLPGQVVISDTTLRDGEQMPGAAFSPAEKLEIAHLLDALGVPLLEVGYPAVSAAEERAVREIAEAGLSAVIQVIARPREADIAAAVRTGAHSIALFIGTSPAHVQDKLRTSYDRVIAEMAQAVTMVKQAGRQAVFAAEDATRTAPGFLADICQAATEAGADAIGLADTAGVASPQQMAVMVAAVASATPLPIAVHCHDDLGLATANSLAALASGASGVQCSLLGIGERAGNAATEQVALALEVILGHHTGLHLPALPGLTHRIAEMLGLSVPPTAPVVGGHAFAHESGLHLDGILRNPATYEPYPADLIGAQRRVMFGKHSGRAAVADALTRHGLSPQPQLVAQLLAEVKREGEAKRPVDEEALIALAAAFGTETEPAAGRARPLHLTGTTATREAHQ